MRSSVVIVDDHARFRAMARALLDVEGYDVVGEASDGASTPPLVERTDPDIVLLDIGLPDMTGFDVAERLTGGRCRVVLISSRDGQDLGSRVVACGAAGFISKDSLSGAELARVLGQPS